MALLTEQDIAEIAETVKQYSGEQSGVALWFARAIEATVIEKLKAQGVAAWLSIDSIGERYLCFSKPADNDTVFELYTLHEGD